MAQSKKKKQKTEKEPQYYTSATNIPTYNYKVYYMKPWEKILYFMLAFVVGAAVGYLFYGGIGKDEFGEPTQLTWVLDITISGITGLVAGKLYVPIKTKQIIAKQQRKLKLQFRDMLESLNTSLGAGKNVADSFNSVYEDLKMQYEENAYILKEMHVILSGMANNIEIENLLQNFGERSGLDDIKSFANVFRICYRKGGNIKDTIRSTHEILSDKMEMSEDIETVVTSNKTEQKVMMVMPIAIVALIKFSSPDFAANFATPTGIVSTTIAIIMFVISYFIGKAVLNIKM